MKKILALVIAGTLFAMSSLCVCATEDASTASSTPGGSTSPSLPEKIDELEEQLRKNQEENAKMIADLTKQVQDLTKAVQASQSNKGGGSQPKKSSGNGGSSSDSKNNFYARNNLVGYGNNIVGQGGHVEINGGRSNVTFVLSTSSYGDLSSANSLAGTVKGTLLNVVSTSSPGVAFQTAKVNFYVSGVVDGDNIAVYQLQGGKWVQLPTAEIRRDHVVVYMSRHGTLAFIRVPVLAAVTG